MPVAVSSAPSGNSISNIWQHWYPSQTPAQPSTANPGATLTSGPVFNYSPSAGGTPTVPSPAGTQAQSILGNQQNFGGLSNLSTNTAQLNAQIGQLPYQLNLPNYSGLLGQASGNALSLLGGNVPSDIQRNLIQSAAQRGIATGMPGAPATNASYLQSLGLTGLGLQQQGLQNFGSLMGMTPTGPQFNPASMYVGPEAYQQAQSAANLYNAAPIPAYAQQAQFNALNQGLNRGQAATAPQQPAAQTQSADLVNSILQKYAPTATGAPTGSTGDVNQPGYYTDPATGTTVDIWTGEPVAQSSSNVSANDYFPGIDDSSSFDNLYSADYGGEG